MTGYGEGFFDLGHLVAIIEHRTWRILAEIGDFEALVGNSSMLTLVGSKAAILELSSILYLLGNRAQVLSVIGRARIDLIFFCGFESPAFAFSDMVFALGVIIVLHMVLHILTRQVFALFSILFHDTSEARVTLDREDWDLLSDGLELWIVVVHARRVMSFEILGRKTAILVMANCLIYTYNFVFWQPRLLSPGSASETWRGPPSRVNFTRHLVSKARDGVVARSRDIHVHGHRLLLDNARS